MDTVGLLALFTDFYDPFEIIPLTKYLPSMQNSHAGFIPSLPMII
jgi:hypothetical protein